FRGAQGVFPILDALVDVLQPPAVRKRYVLAFGHRKMLLMVGKSRRAEPGAQSQWLWLIKSSALAASIATMGKRMSASAQRYSPVGSKTSSTASRTSGTKDTSNTSANEASAAQLSLWLVNGPILNSEWVERMLNACTTCESASTR